MVRYLALFVAAAMLTVAQGSIYTGPFAGLATPYDGSVVYFSSVLRTKGSNQPLHGKLFVADKSGVRLFRSREKMDPPPPENPEQCNLGLYYEFYSGAELNGSGNVIAAPMTQLYAGNCTHAVHPATDLITRSGEREIPAIVRLSANGRNALEYTTFMFGDPSVKYLDLTSGLETPVTLPQVGPYLSTAAWGRLIADDGTALFAGYVLRPAAAPVPWPLPTGAWTPVIDAAGRHLLYSVERQDIQTIQDDGRLEVLELATNQTRVLATGSPLQYMLSDDGSTAMYVQDGRVFVAATDGSGQRAVINDGVAEAVLSGNGKVVYASTSAGRLIKADVETGRQAEIIGRTPFLAKGGYVDAGLVATIEGIALSETSLQGTPPLNPWLGNVTMWMGERKVPVFAVSPTEVRFLPWDTPASAQASVLAEVAGEHSPFDFPQTTFTVWTDGRAGAVAHQDWSSLAYVGPFKLGEIVHISAVGLGAVTPEVPPGAVAPSKEPLARLASPLRCQDSDVLYAGLAPGTLERIYQVDLRLNATGYRRFDCSSGGKPALGLTFYVVP